MLTQRLENVRQRLTAEGIGCLAQVPGFNVRYLTVTEDGFETLTTFSRELRVVAT